MPKSTDPTNISGGSGNPEAVRSNYGVTGTGGTGTLSAPAETKKDYGIKEGTLSPVTKHVQDPQGAHAASAIQIDKKPEGVFTSGNVEGALDELSALIPPAAPTTGNYKDYLDLMGIPDWGVLKLKDAGLLTHALQSSDGDVYPYYWVPSHPAIEYKPFEPNGTIVYPTAGYNEGGNDPTDSTFNVWNAGYVGGGPGWCHAGTYTESVGNSYVSTAHVYPWEGNDPLGLVSHSVVVTGAVSPADRGVLAIFFWPAGGNLAAFLAQALDVKCKAALLLGQGIFGSTTGSPRDGDPGGIFIMGVDSGGDYDPYGWPGQATGQGSLSEIHTGVSDITAAPFAGAPYLNFDGLGGQGCDAVVNYPDADERPYPGQVRLGTDSKAHPSGTTVGGGIPVLGAVAAARGGGNNNNFFRYRLPYLDDYSSTSGGGLKYTHVAEQARYYMKPAISLNPGTDLTQAGNYPDFDKTYWPMQVARYRHQFAMEAPAVVPGPAGSYFMVHFRKEEYFEDFAITGTISADRIYSANAVDWADIEAVTNVTETATPYNPSTFYHVIRSGIYAEDIEAYDDPVLELGYTYTIPTPTAAPDIDKIMCVSGIRYFTPRDEGTGDPNFQLLTCTTEASGVFGHGVNDRNAYLFDTAALYLWTMNPGCICTGCFSMDDNLTPTYGIKARQRVEFSIAQINDQFWNGLGAPLPLPADHMILSLGATTFEGDTDPCAFSVDARPVAVWKRPMQQEDLTLAIGLTKSIPHNNTLGDKILYHGAVDPAVGTPLYGNYTIPGTPDEGKAVASLVSGYKDVEEKFLDEVYRYYSQWTSCPVELISGAPGATAIDVPVRAGTANDDGGDLWTKASYLQGADGGGIAYYAQTIEDGVGLDMEAQVAGLPHRNPPIIDGAYSPYPNAGLLKYPCVNYSTMDYRPSDNIAYADITDAQFNYDSCTGTRYYVRCFDTSFLHHPVYAQVSTGISAPGQSQVVVRIDGLKLADFMYSGAPNANVVISAKIPGITAWLDIGRYDTATPIGDGNGCKYGTEANPSAYTIEGQDPQTFIWYSQVHLEMTNELFINSIDAMVPLLIQVAFESTGATEHMDLEWDGAADNPDASSALIKGIVGIRIVHPSEL